eukprot:gene15924-biopygen23238
MEVLAPQMSHPQETRHHVSLGVLLRRGTYMPILGPCCSLCSPLRPREDAAHGRLRHLPWSAGRSLRRAGRTLRRGGRTFRRAGRTLKGAPNVTSGGAGRTLRRAGHTLRRAGRTLRRAGRTLRRAGGQITTCTGPQ